MEQNNESVKSVHLFVSNLTKGSEDRGYQEILRTHYEDLLRGGNWFRNEVALEPYYLDGRKRYSVLLDKEKIGDLIASEVDMYETLKKSGKKMYLKIDIKYEMDYYSAEKIYVPSIYCMLIE